MLLYFQLVLGGEALLLHLPRVIHLFFMLFTCFTSFIFIFILFSLSLFLFLFLSRNVPCHHNTIQVPYEVLLSLLTLLLLFISVCACACACACACVMCFLQETGNGLRLRKTNKKYITLYLPFSIVVP